jgi:hypothetical protein
VGDTILAVSGRDISSLSAADVALLVRGQPATALELAILTSRAAVCHQHSDQTLVGVGMQLKPDKSRSRIGFVVVERLTNTRRTG